MKRGKKRATNFKTFTKQWVARLMYLAVIDLQISYILAFLGRENIAEELSKVIVLEIVGVMVGYFCKSFFETREEEKNRVQEGETAPESPAETEGEEV